MRAAYLADAPVPPMTAEQYFALVGRGVLQADDHVELLEGVVVNMSPQNPRHAAAVGRTMRVLMGAVGGRAVIRVQMPLLIGVRSVPEPDVCVVSGREGDYDRSHPTSALLVVEVADASLAQDRITKAAIYAAATIPELWVLNLRDECLEVFRDPDSRSRTYRITSRHDRGAVVEMVSFPGVSIRVDDLLPNP